MFASMLSLDRNAGMRTMGMLGRREEIVEQIRLLRSRAFADGKSGELEPGAPVELIKAYGLLGIYDLANGNIAAKKTVQRVLLLLGSFASTDANSMFSELQNILGQLNLTT